MEVEGMEKTTNEGQIILLGKDIEEEDKGEDEEAEASDNESVKVKSVIFKFSIGNSFLKKRTKSI